MLRRLRPPGFGFGDAVVGDFPEECFLVVVVDNRVVFFGGLVGNRFSIG